jgi:hypothetical protein
MILLENYGFYSIYPAGARRIVEKQKIGIKNKWIERAKKVNVEIEVFCEKLGDSGCEAGGLCTILRSMQVIWWRFGTKIRELGTRNRESRTPSP